MQKGILIVKRLSSKREYYYAEVEAPESEMTKFNVIKILKPLTDEGVFPAGFRLRYLRPERQDPFADENMKLFELNKEAIKAIFEKLP
jgi:hypothetical protein